jgi:hypothetical protein
MTIPSSCVPGLTFFTRSGGLPHLTSFVSDAYLNCPLATYQMPFAGLRASSFHILPGNIILYPWTVFDVVHRT